MPPSFDPDALNEMASIAQTNTLSPILILSPSSLSHRPKVLESILSSLPSSQPYDLQMLDRIALGFAQLPQGYYVEAMLALPPTEETPGEIDTAYMELHTVFIKILNAMQPGGHVRIGHPKEVITKEAILAGFLIETQNGQVVSFH